MLRQGLAVLVFSTLETFIRERTGELLRSFTNRKLSFSDLSPALQKATTLGALEGVRFRLKLQPAAGKIAWLVANLAPIAGATVDVRNLSDHSFGYAGSNIDEDDVADILRAFGVNAPWTHVTALTARIGIAILDAEAEFVALKKRRHSSAHALIGSVLYTDLENSVRSSLGICIAFDLLLSHAAGLINKKLGPGHGGRPPLSHDGVPLVIVSHVLVGNPFVVRREQLPPPAPVIVRPTVKTFTTQATAVAFGQQYARRTRRQLIVTDATAIPTDWTTWPP